jgi:hypothetical protein
MKKFFFWSIVACCFSSGVFSGCVKEKIVEVEVCCCSENCNCPCCNKDDGPKFTITATVENGSAYNSVVDVVKALERMDKSPWGEGKYENGGFIIEIPETVEGQYLGQLAFNVLPDFTVSDEDYQVALLQDFKGYKSGKLAGIFVYGKGTEIENKLDYYLSITEAQYIYADTDVTMTGSDEETESGYDEENKIDYDYTYHLSINLSLEKGWNMVYLTLTYTEEIDIEDKVLVINEKMSFSSTNIGGLKWYFDDSSDNKSLKNHKTSRFQNIPSPEVKDRVQPFSRHYLR